jgi:hypothetical protein
LDTTWRDEVAFAENFVAGSPELGIRGTLRDGDTIALREVLVHMIEEYARRCGHADLLGNGSTDASASDSGKPARLLLPDHKGRSARNTPRATHTDTGTPQRHPNPRHFL